MEIILNRFGKGIQSYDLATIGELTVTNKIKCLILEDDYDETKVFGHTRIPAGRYELKLRTEGKNDEKYSKRFPEFHIGMIHLQNVPNYLYVLIHCGNTSEDTAGCLLTGTNKVCEDEVSGSEIAYRKIYPVISQAILKERVFINIID